MILPLTLLVAVSAVLIWALHSEFQRLDREARMREHLATNPKALRLRRGFATLTIEIRDSFTPALLKVAEHVRLMSEARNGTKRPTKLPHDFTVDIERDRQAENERRFGA